jgi:hypothetical protein
MSRDFYFAHNAQCAGINSYPAAYAALFLNEVDRELQELLRCVGHVLA